MPGLQYCTTLGALCGYGTVSAVLGAAAGRRFSVSDVEWKTTFTRIVLLASFLLLLLACSSWIVEMTGITNILITFGKLSFT